MLRNAYTPSLGWNPAARQYQWLEGPSKGDFAPRKAVRLALDTYLEAKTKEAADLGEELRRRAITAEQFYTRLERIIIDSNLAGAALAKGGWAQMKAADFIEAQDHIVKELRYARDMMRQINNKLSLDGRFLNRVKMYGQAARWMYHNVQRLDLIDAGMRYEKSIRHVSDSCPECVILEEEGWKPIGTLPLPGDRICLRNCKCTMEYK